MDEHQRRLLRTEPTMVHKSHRPVSPPVIHPGLTGRFVFTVTFRLQYSSGGARPVAFWRLHAVWRYFTSDGFMASKHYGKILHTCGSCLTNSPDTGPLELNQYYFPLFHCNLFTRFLMGGNVSFPHVFYSFSRLFFSLSALGCLLLRSLAR